MTNLTVAMLAVGPVLLLGGILFLIGSSTCPETWTGSATDADERGGFHH